MVQAEGKDRPEVAAANAYPGHASKRLAVAHDSKSIVLQVKVKDRSVVTTADAETRAVTPEGLQSRINKSVRGTPSGTLD